MPATIYERIRRNLPALSVGMISADLMRLSQQTAALEENGCQFAHFDVMDGQFAPLLTAGPFFVKGLRTAMLKDVHLMVECPVEAINAYAAAGADMITVHVESRGHIHRALQMIAECKNANDPSRGIAAGIALNPGTPVESLLPFLDMVDLIFLLAVNPGYAGQKFAPSTAGRFAMLKKMAADRGRPLLLGIDGGVTRDNIHKVAALKPDFVVAGSAVFDKGAVAENLRFMQDALAGR